MCWNCNCKEKNFDFEKGGIFFALEQDHCGPDWYTKIECICCGSTYNVLNRTLREEKNIFLLDLREATFIKEIYLKEFNVIYQILKDRCSEIVNYLAIMYQILYITIKMYEEWYYEYFYQYRYEVLREAMITLYINRFKVKKKEYKDENLFLRSFKAYIKHEKADFVIVDFLNQRNCGEKERTDIVKYGPCSVGLITFKDFQMCDSKNAVFLKKVEYVKNEKAIKTKIQATQLWIHQIFEKFLLDNFSDLFMENVKKYQITKNVDCITAFTESMKYAKKKDEILVIGMQKLLNGILIRKNIKISEITFENHERILKELEKQKELIETYLC